MLRIPQLVNERTSLFNPMWPGCKAWGFSNTLCFLISHESNGSNLFGTFHIKKKNDCQHIFLSTFHLHSVWLFLPQFGWFFFFFLSSWAFVFLFPPSSCSLISSFFLTLYFFSTLSFPIPLMKVDNNLWIQVELHFWNCTLMLEPIKLDSEKWEKS